MKSNVAIPKPELLFGLDFFLPSIFLPAWTLHLMPHMADFWMMTSLCSLWKPRQVSPHSQVQQVLCTRPFRRRLVQRSRCPQWNLLFTQASMHLPLNTLDPVDHGTTKAMLVAWKTVIRCSMRNRTSARCLLFDPDRTFFLLQQLVQEAQQLCMQLQPCMQLPLLLALVLRLDAHD